MRALASAVVLLSLAIAGCGEKAETKVVPHSPVVDKTIKATQERKAAKEAEAEKAEEEAEEEAPGEAPAPRPPRPPRAPRVDKPSSSGSEG